MFVFLLITQYIYIYIEREREREREIVAFVVFKRQTIEVFGWCSFSILCEGLSTFHNLSELLLGFVSTNTTQILQARKQMECDNNKY